MSKPCIVFTKARKCVGINCFIGLSEVGGVRGKVDKYE